jgi:hypothetical protein
MATESGPGFALRLPRTESQESVLWTPCRTRNADRAPVTTPLRDRPMVIQQFDFRSASKRPRPRDPAHPKRDRSPLAARHECPVTPGRRP